MSDLIYNKVTLGMTGILEVIYKVALVPAYIPQLGPGMATFGLHPGPWNDHNSSA